MDERFTSNQPIDEQPKAAVPPVRLAILTTLLVVPLVLLLVIVLKPATARATILQVANLFSAKSKSSPASGSNTGAILETRDARGIASQPPQAQAETLLQQAIGGSSAALDELSSRTPDWQGQLTMTPRLTGLLDSAVNANDMNVRSEALDLELAANNMAKTPEAEDALIARIDKEPASRPWGLWMLGALANRGVETNHALVVLAGYAHDPDANTRYWAATGIALVGSDPTVPLLLQILRNDASPQVREVAGCGLAQAGMLTKEQRRRAVPALVRYAGDASLDAATRTWVYQALRDITGANVANDPAAWRGWLSNHSGD
jgi:hypothetical protein